MLTFLDLPNIGHDQIRYSLILAKYVPVLVWEGAPFSHSYLVYSIAQISSHSPCPIVFDPRDPGVIYLSSSYGHSGAG